MIMFTDTSVNDTESGVSSRVRYSVDLRADQRKCVTLYPKDHRHHLATLFPRDYREAATLNGALQKGRVNLFEEHPLYPQARARAESLQWPNTLINRAWRARTGLGGGCT